MKPSKASIRRYARRLLLAFLVSGALLVAGLPAHEYLHCVFAWSRGTIEGPCRVAYTGNVVFGEAGRALIGDEPIPAWEHPLIYALTYGGPVLVFLVLANPFTWEWRLLQERDAKRPCGDAEVRA